MIGILNEHDYHFAKQERLLEMATSQSNLRVSARVTSRVYETLAQAAELSGATMNQFIVQSAYEKAQEVIEKERFIRMTTRSASVFFEALENPPEPTKKLKQAARAYQGSDNDSED